MNNIYIYIYREREREREIKANLNRENTQEGGELGFKISFSNTINSRKKKHKYKEIGLEEANS